MINFQNDELEEVNVDDEEVIMVVSEVLRMSLILLRFGRKVEGAGALLLLEVVPTKDDTKRGDFRELKLVANWGNGGGSGGVDCAREMDWKLLRLN